jgi:hypothetical protein
MWNDPDRRPFKEKPEEYFSGFAWDGANQLIFRPVSRFFAVDPGGEAVNVNAFDEVPNSSWFQNRIGRAPLALETFARGSCDTPLPSQDKPWSVTEAKPNGANPGFIIKASDGKKYLLKFDGLVQGPRATAADVVGSVVYHAAGYFTPCNRIVFFRPDLLKLDEDATAENAAGEEVKMTRGHVDTVLAKGLRLPDGRYRANMSLFMEGKPLGPWTYEGRRGDDPNDVVNHEDRRELRGMRLLAAWINHFDSREMNTLAMWISSERGGYVRHNMVDFGDSLGSIWEPPAMGRRIGHSYYLDFGHVLGDFASLGIVRRRWDHTRFGPSGPVFSYFDVDTFEPDEWKPGYPNPAFGRMTERDGAWMARIIARFDDAHLRVLVGEAKLNDAFLDEELFRLLKGRRDKILARYLNRLSPLADPQVENFGGTSALCVNDLGVLTKMAGSYLRRYNARGFVGLDMAPVGLGVRKLDNGRACSALPSSTGASAQDPAYMIVDLTASGPQATLPLRVHLYQLGANDYRVVGIQRPSNNAPPSE